MTKVEELRESIITMAIEPTARAEVTFNLDSLIAAVREDERNRIEAEGFLLRDCNAVLQIGKCSVIPTAELNAIAEYCNVPEPKGADNDQG